MKANHGLRLYVIKLFTRSVAHRISPVMLLALLAGCGGESGSTPPSASEGEQAVVPQHSMIVDNSLDQPDAMPGDHICASDEGYCTIRAAIMEANASGFNADGERHTILIPAGYYSLSIPNTLSTADVGIDAVPDRPVTSGDTTGSLLLEVPMTIRGEGARSTVIDANQIDRVFEIDSGADSTISDITITGGAGNTLGGGVYAQAHLSLERVQITGNRASGGGGIFVNPQGSLALSDSTVSHNIANGQAGGIRIDTRGTITNSTISHNEALGLTEPLPAGTGVPFAFAQGGGIDVRGISTVIHNSTIAFNRAAAGGAGLHFDTAYVDALPDPLTGAVDLPHFDVILENTIISNNSADVAQADCLTTVGVSRILSQGHNLDSDGSCNLDAIGDLPETDPMLGPLIDNGGPTDTHALQAGSPAIAAGDVSSCTTSDQRSVLRTSDGTCDIGAYERSRH